MGLIFHHRKALFRQAERPASVPAWQGPASSLAQYLGRKIAGRALRERFTERLPLVDAWLANRRDKDAASAMHASVKGVPKRAQLRLGLATGVYALIAHTPGTTLIALALALYWIVVGILTVVAML